MLEEKSMQRRSLKSKGYSESKVSGRLHQNSEYQVTCSYYLKYKNYTDFYKFLLLLSGDESLNPGPI